ncbi:hypothetical protein GCM10010289_86500 [Streptomyces violascens]|nr:hypothetical protein GCM10010289_86500 [Streptomyces violascens]
MVMLVSVCASGAAVAGRPREAGPLGTAAGPRYVARPCDRCAYPGEEGGLFNESAPDRFAAHA